FGQRQISTIYGQANQYRVILEAMPEYQTDPSWLTRLYVPALPGGSSTQSSSQLTTATAVTTTQVAATGQVPLSTFAELVRRTTPLTISHQEQFPAATISFNVAPGAALSDAVAVISAAQRDIDMPDSIIGSYSGDAAEFARSLAGQPWLILAAAITIYIVLGVLYESTRRPHAAAERPHGLPGRRLRARPAAQSRARRLRRCHFGHAAGG